MIRRLDAPNLSRGGDRYQISVEATCPIQMKPSFKVAAFFGQLDPRILRCSIRMDSNNLPGSLVSNKERSSLESPAAQTSSFIARGCDHEFLLPFVIVGRELGLGAVGGDQSDGWGW